MELTILMPSLNEEKTIFKCIDKALSSIKRLNIQAEVLVADNGSTDRTIEIVCSYEENVRLISVNKLGYGNALIEGIEQAKGRFIIMADSDDSYNFLEIDGFYEKLKEGYDMVIGNRFSGGIEENAMPFLHRYLGNPVLSFLGRLFYQIKIKDFHCGFRGFKRDEVMNLKLCCGGMDFASEMIVKSSLHNLSLTEIPIKLYKDGRDRKPHLNTWRDGWRHLKFLLLFSPKWVFLYPGILLSTFGLTLFAILLNTDIQIANINLSIHTMIYSSSLFIIGIQLFSFYIFSKQLRDSVLLSKAPVMRKSRLTIEIGLVAGGVTALAGLILFFLSVFYWADKSFGNLDPLKMMKLVMPSITLLIVGVILLFNSFFLNLVALITKK